MRVLLSKHHWLARERGLQKGREVRAVWITMAILPTPGALLFLLGAPVSLAQGFHDPDVFPEKIRPITQVCVRLHLRLD